MNELLQKHCSLSQIIIDMMILGVVIGAIDYYRGNKWGLGKKFEEAFSAFFPLLLMVGGITTLVPLMGKLLAPVLSPVFRLIGADPGIFPGMLLSCDMGGFPLAMELAETPAGGEFGGLILGGLMGVNIVFNIPVALGMIEKSDRDYMARGFLYGFITIPLGGLAGGLAAGLPLKFVLIQLIPVTAVSVLIALLMKAIPAKLVKAFIGFGKGVAFLALAGLVTGIVVELAGIDAGALHLESAKTGLSVVGSIIIILPGAYVVVELLSRIFHRAFLKLGAKLDVNDTAVLGMLATLANSIPTFAMVKDMDAKGKVVNFAFIAGGAFALGDYLGFCAAVAPKLIVPMIVAKLTAAFSAVLLVLFVFRRSSRKNRINEPE
ncbi:MAG: ethanolamine utilization protein EutH [Victivallaceae bacterium]|nr:ethanolamine utilization protein EutH [Victivallaceae bacterium]